MLKASADTRKVLVVLWLVRNNDECNTITTTGITRRTGLSARDVRRVLSMLRRRGMVTQPGQYAQAFSGSPWFTTAKGNAYAERIQQAFTAADNARRAAELAR
jgi:DNA-binding IclR family transcriptional regulator